MSGGKRQRGRGRSGGTVSISLIVMVFLVVMVIQILTLRDKDKGYAQKLDGLRQEYQQETERATEIDELQEYMKSDAFIEDTAKSKLGLAYDNETIYKQSGE